MKTAPRLLQIVAMLVMSSATFAAAKSENAALVIKIDGEGWPDPDNCCFWDFGIQGLVGQGSIHYVETQNGQWRLSCHGEIVEGLPISKAVTASSTDDNPIGGCFTPFGATFDWHVTYSPSGLSSLDRKS